MSEPEAGIATSRRSVPRRSTDGDEYVVNGSKMWLTNGLRSGLVMTLVKTDPEADPPHRGMSMLIVEKEPAASRSRRPDSTVGKNIEKMGYKGVETTEMTFSDFGIPQSSLLGTEEGQGFRQVLDGIEIGRVNVAARAVGVATRAFEEAIRYSQERKAFGKAISQHQAIQIHLAEMGTTLEAAKLMLYSAAEKKSSGERCDLEAGMAKLFASEACHEIVTKSLRVHGGLRLLQGVHDRTPLPGRAVPADRRGHQRDPEDRHRPPPAGEAQPILAALMGLGLPHYDTSLGGAPASWEGVKRVARLAEATGYDSVWVSDGLLPRLEQVRRFVRDPEAPSSVGPRWRD